MEVTMANVESTAVKTVNAKGESAVDVYRARKIKMASSGMKIALLMPFSAIVQNIFNSSVTDTVYATLTDKIVVSVICSITLVALGDFFAAIFTFIYNAANGKGITELRRTIHMKVSWFMLLAAAVAGPIATGCWMAATPFCGLTMVAVITSLGPILTAFISRFVLHEKLNARIVAGICIVVGGAIIAGWSGASGGSNYVIGLILAFLAPIGFTLEGQLSTYAGDMIDPNIGCGFFRCLGSCVCGLVFMLILSAITGNIDAFGQIIAMSLTTPKLLLFVILMGLCGAINYNAAYLAFNRTGPSRTLAIDASRPLWSIPLGFLFAALGVAEYSVTGLAVVGACIVVVGLILVISKPSDLVNLRNVE
jgi:drug/metabolite transporter (DMT)-like permease